MSKSFSKYIASFDCFDKSLIVLSTTSGNSSVTSFATVIGAPIGIASSSFSLEFSMSARIVKKLLKKHKLKRKIIINLLWWLEVH